MNSFLAPLQATVYIVDVKTQYGVSTSFMSVRFHPLARTTLLWVIYIKIQYGHFQRNKTKLQTMYFLLLGDPSVNFIPDSGKTGSSYRGILGFQCWKEPQGPLTLQATQQITAQSYCVSICYQAGAVTLALLAINEPQWPTSVQFAHAILSCSCPSFLFMVLDFWLFLAYNMICLSFAYPLILIFSFQSFLGV